MGEAQEFLQMHLEGAVPLLQAKQFDAGKVIHEQQKQKTGKKRENKWGENTNDISLFSFWSSILSRYGE